MRSWWLFFATCGPIGYLPYPGTMGSLVAMIGVCLLHMYHVSLAWYTIISAVLLYVSFPIVDHSLDILEREDDPAEIVIDELVGILIAFWGVVLTPESVFVGFVLFRFFDISKWGIVYLEQLKGSLGIVLDDVAAGILSNIVLRLFVYYS